MFVVVHTQCFRHRRSSVNRRWNESDNSDSYTFRVRRDLKAYPVLLFHLQTRILRPKENTFSWSPSQVLVLWRLCMPGSALLSSWAAVPTSIWIPSPLSAPQGGTLKLAKPLCKVSSFLCHWFPQSPSLVPGSSPDFRQIQTIDFGFLWLRIHDFPQRPCFRAILQNLNSRILTKGNLMKTQTSGFFHIFGVFFGHFPTILPFQGRGCLFDLLQS